jgi:AraC family transcriptional regulator
LRRLPSLRKPKRRTQDGQPSAGEPVISSYITLKHGGIVLYPPGATFGPREMRDYELVWMIEGDGVYETDRVKHSAPAGSVVLCRPGAIDHFTWDAKRTTTHAFFHFDLDWAASGLTSVERWPTVRQFDGEDIVRPMFRHLLAWHGRGDRRQCELGLAHLLTAFVNGETSLRQVPREVHSESVVRALNLIYERLRVDAAAPIALAELAAVACVSPEHLCRLFMAETGHSPAATVRMARLDRALVLVTRSNYTFSQIAALCGFSDAFHFSRLFKAAFGQPPKEARRRTREGSIPPLLLLLESSD